MNGVATKSRTIFLASLFIGLFIQPLKGEKPQGIEDSGEYPIYTEDLDHVEEDNEAKRSGHLLRFARRLNDYEDIFTKRGGDDHFLRFAKKSDPHLLRFAKRGSDNHFLRFAKAGDDHFLRFAKAGDDHFLRFAKGGDDHFLRFAKGGDDHFLRFAKAGDDHFLRFAKGGDDHFLRFAKGGDDHFLRFAKRLKYYLRGSRDQTNDHMLRFARSAPAMEDGDKIRRDGNTADEHLLRFA